LDHLTSQKTGPFLTTNFKYALKSPTELITVLSFIDLPFAAGQHRFLKESVGFSVEAGDNMLAYHKEICEAEKEDNNKDVVLLQRFFEANDRFTVSEDNKKTEKYITKFYAKRVYGCQIVVTNFTEGEIDCQVIHKKSVNPIDPLSNSTRLPAFKKRFHPEK
jgi:hypothetical protein